MKYFSLLLFVLCFSSVKAQDPIFTHYFSNPLYLNPAFAGSEGCSRISNSNMVNSIGSMNLFSSVSYDQQVKALRGGIGINYSFVREEKISSPQYSQQVNVFYAYNINLGENTVLKPAINIGFGHQYLDFTPVFFFDYGNPEYYYSTIVPDKSSINYFNIGSGLLFICKNFVSGIAIDHITNPSISYWEAIPIRLPARFTVHTSYQFNFSESNTLTPSLIYKKQADASHIAVNASYKHKKIIFGVGLSKLYDKYYDYKTGKESINSHYSYVNGLIGYQSKKLSLNFGPLIQIYKSSLRWHDLEFSLVYKFNCKNKTDNFKTPQISSF